MTRDGAPITDAELEAVFSFLGPEEAVLLREYLQARDCAAGSILVRDGEKSDYVGFVVSGRLSVKKQTEFFGKYIIVAVLERGSIFGEGAMSDCLDRSTIITALEDSRLLLLSREKMTVLCERNPALATKLYRRFLYVSHIRLQKAGERLPYLL